MQKHENLSTGIRFQMCPFAPVARPEPESLLTAKVSAAETSGSVGSHAVLIKPELSFAVRLLSRLLRLAWHRAGGLLARITKRIV